MSDILEESGLEAHAHELNSNSNFNLDPDSNPPDFNSNPQLHSQLQE